MLCKKCEPEQKTASKSVGAEQRKSLACIEKKNRAKIPKGGSFFWRREIAAVTKTDQKKIFLSCTFFQDNNW